MNDSPMPSRLGRGRWPADRILIAVATALLLALLFPPFEITVQGARMGLGFAFIFTGASWSMNGQPLAGFVNAPQLECEMMMIMAIGLIALAVGRFDSKPQMSANELAALRRLLREGEQPTH